MIRKIFDSDNHNVWFFIGLAIFIVGLLISVFVPVFYSLMRFKGNHTIGFSPTEGAFYYQFLAFLLLSLSFYFIYKIKNVGARVTSGIIGLFCMILFTIFGYQSYIHIHEQYIEFGKGYSVVNYPYEHFKELYLLEKGDSEYFELVTADGEKIEVGFGEMFDTQSMNYIRRTLESNGIKMVDKRD